MFHYNEINKFSKALEENKGVLIGGSHGRNIVNNTYIINNISGNCDIVIGKSIFGRINDICTAVEEIRTSGMPTDFVYEDDITMCYFILKDKQLKNKQHYSVPLKCIEFPSNNGLSNRNNHMEMRNITLSYLLNLSREITDPTPPASGQPLFARSLRFLSPGPDPHRQRHDNPNEIQKRPLKVAIVSVPIYMQSL
jgi:hypothetical protein